MRKTGLFLVAALALVFLSTFAASELGGEVVILTTRDADGAPHETSLWIVEDDGSLWLRAGNSDSKWLGRIRAEPAVEVARGGQVIAYRAEIVSGRADRINEKMAEAYGWADSMIGVMRENGLVTAIRLVPLDR